VDFSKANLEVCQKYLNEAGYPESVQFINGDARYLLDMPHKKYDAALMMGLRYHLVKESDRQIALKEAYTHLRPGGVIFSAFTSRFGIFGVIMKILPESIEDHRQLRSVVERGRDREDWLSGGFRAYFATVKEIALLHEKTGLKPSSSSVWNPLFRLMTKVILN
jgi:ubiquinone/menaquinone biosynthesis C-methylase UbiE